MQIAQAGLTNHHPAFYQWPIRFKDLASKNRLVCRHLQGWPRSCRQTHTGNYVTHLTPSTCLPTDVLYISRHRLPAVTSPTRPYTIDNTVLIGSSSTADTAEVNSTTINSHISASTANTADHDITAWPLNLHMQFIYCFNVLSQL